MWGFFGILVGVIGGITTAAIKGHAAKKQAEALQAMHAEEEKQAAEEAANASNGSEYILPAAAVALAAALAYKKLRR